MLLAAVIACCVDALSTHALFFTSFSSSFMYMVPRFLLLFRFLDYNLSLFFYIAFHFVIRFFAKLSREEISEPINLSSSCVNIQHVVDPAGSSCWDLLLYCSRSMTRRSSWGSLEESENLLSILDRRMWKWKKSVWGNEMAGILVTSNNNNRIFPIVRCVGRVIFVLLLPTSSKKNHSTLIYSRDPPL